MSRLNGVLFIADGLARQVINAIPGLSYVPPSDGSHPHLHYARDGEVYDIIVMQLRQNIAIPGQTSRAASGRWDAYLLYADGGVVDPRGIRWLGRAWRYLRRRAAAQPGWVLVFSLAEVVRRWPAAEVYFRDDETGEWSFPILFGDAHESLAAVNYNPSDTDCENDVEIEDL